MMNCTLYCSTATFIYRYLFTIHFFTIHNLTNLYFSLPVLHLANLLLPPYHQLSIHPVSALLLSLLHQLLHQQIPPYLTLYKITFFPLACGSTACVGTKMAFGSGSKLNFTFANAPGKIPGISSNNRSPYCQAAGILCYVCFGGYHFCAQFF